jgi:hypothetical protein
LSELASPNQLLAGLIDLLVHAWADLGVFPIAERLRPGQCFLSLSQGLVYVCLGDLHFAEAVNHRLELPFCPRQICGSLCQQAFSLDKVLPLCVVQVRNPSEQLAAQVRQGLRRLFHLAGRLCPVCLWIGLQCLPGRSHLVRTIRIYAPCPLAKLLQRARVLTLLLLPGVQPLKCTLGIGL